jgi:hypothetical protein
VAARQRRRHWCDHPHMAPHDPAELPPDPDLDDLPDELAAG